MSRNHYVSMNNVCVIFLNMFRYFLVLISISVTTAKLDNAVARGYGLDWKTMFKESSAASTRQKSLILPGTKWCGAGNKAKDDDDLGYYQFVDSCCRSHDKCPLKIKKNEEKWGLKNTIGYTASDCKCDDAFYTCLKQVTRKKAGWFESHVGKMAGRIFFNLLKTPCVVVPVSYSTGQAKFQPAKDF